MFVKITKKLLLKIKKPNNTYKKLQLYLELASTQNLILEKSQGDKNFVILPNFWSKSIHGNINCLLWGINECCCNKLTQR